MKFLFFTIMTLTSFSTSAFVADYPVLASYKVVCQMPTKAPLEFFVEKVKTEWGELIYHPDSSGLDSFKWPSCQNCSASLVSSVPSTNKLIKVQINYENHSKRLLEEKRSTRLFIDFDWASPEGSGEVKIVSGIDQIYNYEYGWAQVTPQKSTCKITKHSPRMNSVSEYGLPHVQPQGESRPRRRPPRG